MIEGKLWGTTKLVTANKVCELHHILIKAGGYCSIHKHQTKSNGFYVLSGRLLVRVWKPSGAVDETRLKEGDYMVVNPGLKHQFEAISDCEALELYWAEYSADDIERDSIGGMHG